MKEFLRFCGLGECNIVPQTADASTRRYYRVEGADKPCLIMDAPPPHDIDRFIAIAKHLQAIGLAVPETYQQQQHYLLLQDFGDDSFSRLLQSGADAALLYDSAIDVLIHLYKKADAKIDLPDYSDEVLYNEAELFPLWYMKHELSVEANDDFMKAYRKIIYDTLQALPPLRPCLVMRDYHIDNLMQVQGLKIGKDSPLQACGLLDFQDALIGSPAYDLMSILEDARITVPADIQNAMIKKYLTATDLPPDDFALHYSVHACIRHLKVLGIFVRLEARDNKPHYRQHLNHVKALLQRHLQKPHWQDLQKLLQASIPNF